jgi:hypothetical protein
MSYFDLSLSVEATGLTPRDLVEIRVGSMTAKVYPKIMPMMAVFEWAHTFQVNKTILTNLQADLRLVFDAFGGQLNSTSTVDGIYSDWKCHFNEHWHNFNNLTVLSFPNSAGNQINNKTLLGNPQVLLHIQDGNLAHCCSQKVHFVCVKCTLDFTLRQHMVCNPTPLILCMSYYFELPQSTRTMISGNEQAYTLVTYAGPKDFCTLSPANVQLQILAACMQDSPILLKASDFNLPLANTNAFEVGLKIERKIRQLAWPEICASAFHKVCPGYSDKPHAALEHIRQTYKDSNGTLVTSPVFAYYQRDINAICHFSKDVCFPVSVCNYLNDGLDQRLTLIFHRNYPDYSQPHDMLASHQCSRFPIILCTMQSAKEEVQTYTFIAWNAGGSQAFHAKATAYPSQAEITLNCYSTKRVKRNDGSTSNATKLGTLPGWESSCFGCRGPHPWMHNKVIMCPHKDLGGIREAATKKYKEWLAKFKAFHKKRKGIDYSCLSNANKEKIKKQVSSSIASSLLKDAAASTITDD